MEKKVLNCLKKVYFSQNDCFSDGKKGSDCHQLLIYLGSMNRSVGSANFKKLIKRPVSNDAFPVRNSKLDPLFRSRTGYKSKTKDLFPSENFFP